MTTFIVLIVFACSIGEFCAYRKERGKAEKIFWTLSLVCSFIIVIAQAMNFVLPDPILLLMDQAEQLFYR